MADHAHEYLDGHCVVCYETETAQAPGTAGGAWTGLTDRALVTQPDGSSVWVTLTTLEET